MTEWTTDEADQIVDAYTRWQRDTRLPADRAERAALSQAMLTAIAHHVTGLADLRDLADAHTEAQQEAHRARLALQAGVVTAVRLGGASVERAAEQAGVTRMTVRSWLGK